MSKNTGNVSKEQRDLDIGRQYFYGYSQRELADRYGVSRATVRRAIEKFRLDREKVDTMGLPTDYDSGQPMYDDYATKTVPTWATYGALAILAGLAGFTGYILYNVFN